MFSFEEIEHLKENCCNQRCLSSINSDMLYKFYLSCIDYSDKESKDAFMLGLLVACTSFETGKKMMSTYRLFNLPVCRNMFESLTATSKKVLDNLRSHVKDQNFLPRVHGNTKNLHNSFTAVTTQNVVNFITNFASMHAIPYPVIRSENPRLLMPSNWSKKSIYSEYQNLSEAPVGYSTFKSWWLQYLPHILISKPRTDVCIQC